jgi:hypothetical protein
MPCAFREFTEEALSCPSVAMLLDRQRQVIGVVVPQNPVVVAKIEIHYF